MLYSVELVGAVVLILGVAMLMDAGGWASNIPLMVGVGLLVGAFLLWLVIRFMRQRHIAVRGGQEQLKGARAEAEYAFRARGHVRLHGERWRAHSHTPVACGEPVVVTRVAGLTLHVEPLSQTPTEGADS